MTIQVYVDDSGGKGHSRHFVLAGLIGFAENWARFSLEWRACLDQEPRVSEFKMRQAAALTGCFRNFSPIERDNKVRSLARIINRHSVINTYSAIDLSAHSASWGKLTKPFNEVYFYPFHNTIIAACHTLWDAGWRERFEIIFDDQVIFGPRAVHWYPAVQYLFQRMFPEQAAILPLSPIFRSDSVCLPIQAADLFAWCRRRATDEGGAIQFDFLVDELKNVKETEYSQFYDVERMEAVLSHSNNIVRNGSEYISQDSLELFKRLRHPRK